MTIHARYFIVHINSFIIYTPGINDLQSVLADLVDVNKWFELGLALGLKQPTLDAITLNHKPADYKREMLTKWLNQVNGCKPTWKALVKALRSPIVQCYNTANEIEQYY